MAAPTYIAVDDLKDRLGIPLNDSRESTLKQAADAASRWVDKQTGRRFYATTETRYYSVVWQYPRWGTYGSSYGDFPWGNPERPGGGGVAGQHCQIDDFLTVTQVATDGDGDGTYETIWTLGSDYWLGPRNAVADGKPYRFLNRNQVTGRYVFPPYENGISVTGSAGYCTIANLPDQIRELAMLVAMQFSRPVMDMSIPGVSKYALGIDLQVTMEAVEITPFMQTILDDFRDPLFS